ncbi:unnamed protein product [Linum tenue]|uniref:TCP domain-containing protein n=1 Tax=Linum tenue TaxID=586396 RepID=A0AAV0NR38_9ROSI|nr:unnamed protein product [Linum tenue]
MGTKGGGGGEIIQVQGGHIVRSTGRKDRHSKVYTAKGPRDRRVRLSAHTAIQFYDVQDRLGYDRPSKAVDWLIKKAKSSIDKLAELPPWHPTAADSANDEEGLESEHNPRELDMAEQSESSGYGFQLHRQLGGENVGNHSAPPSFLQIDPDGIPETMKSFFPTSSTTLSMNFQSYPPDLMSRTANHSEDLGLSLHSFQDQALIPHQQQPDTGNTRPGTHHSLFQTGSGGFDANFQRMVAWSAESGGGSRGDGGGGGGVFGFNNNPHHHQLSPHAALMIGQGSSGLSSQSQRSPLQSSGFVQSIRAWNDLPMGAAAENHHPHHHHQQQQHNSSGSNQRAHEFHQSMLFGSRFLGSEGIHGFRIPARIHGEEDGSVVSDRAPSSASPRSADH